MRALADAENARKRADRDRREAEQYGGTRLARDLLPVYDNLNRALAAIPDESRATSAALIEGVELTLRELSGVMKQARRDCADAGGGRSVRSPAA
jgi:molecular chaperone GrpE